MGLIYEDGTGKSNANSYSSVEDAYTYFADRGINTWLNLERLQQEYALIQATDYIEANYSWATGVVVNEDQALGWPRNGAVDRRGYTIDSNIIPKEVKKATWILAKQIGVDEVDINAPIDRLTIQETAGPVSITYADYANIRRLQLEVDGILQGLARKKSAITTIEMVRG